jgi:hypothetical protein
MKNLVNIFALAGILFFFVYPVVRLLARGPLGGFVAWSLFAIIAVWLFKKFLQNSLLCINLLLMNNKILDKILNKYSIKEQDISCIENVGEMSIKRAIEVYNDNYNIQNMLREMVFYGYEELLNNLSASTLEEVYLYVLELSNGNIIIVFTNVEQDYIVGSIAQFQKRN